jgi:hypothetical protein
LTAERENLPVARSTLPIVTFEKSWVQALIFRDSHITKLIKIVSDYDGKPPPVKIETLDGSTVTFDSGEFDPSHPLTRREIQCIEKGTEALASTQSGVFIRLQKVDHLFQDSKFRTITETAQVSIHGSRYEARAALSEVEGVVSDMVPWYSPMLRSEVCLFAMVCLSVAVLHRSYS